jgi:hypothetical protein
VNWQLDSCHLQPTATVLQRSCNICVAANARSEPVTLQQIADYTNCMGQSFLRSQKIPAFYENRKFITVFTKPDTCPDREQNEHSPRPLTLLHVPFSITLSSTSCYSERPFRFRILRHNQHSNNTVYIYHPTPNTPVTVTRHQFICTPLSELTVNSVSTQRNDSLPNSPNSLDGPHNDTN